MRAFIRDQAFLVAAFVFAGVGLAAMGLGGLALSLRLEDAGWPTIFALAPMYAPAGVAALAAYLLIRRI